MKPRQLFLSINLALLVAFPLLNACSSNNPKPISSTQYNAHEYIEEAVKDTAGLTSIHLHLAAEGNTDNAKILTLDGDLADKPAVISQGHIKYKMSGVVLESDFKIIDNSAYTNAFGPWTSLGDPKKIYDVAAILDPQQGLANILKNIKNPQVTDEESINGIDTLKITGTVTGAVLHSVNPKAQGDTSVVVWIAKSDPHHLVQASVTTGSDSNMKLNLSKWNTDFSVDKP